MFLVEFSEQLKRPRDSVIEVVSWRKKLPLLVRKKILEGLKGSQCKKSRKEVKEEKQQFFHQCV